MYRQDYDPKTVGSTPSHGNSRHRPEDIVPYWTTPLATQQLTPDPQTRRSPMAMVRMGMNEMQPWKLGAPVRWGVGSHVMPGAELAVRNQRFTHTEPTNVGYGFGMRGASVFWPNNTVPNPPSSVAAIGEVAMLKYPYA